MATSGLDGQTVIVTGAGSGIGRATALRFVHAGAGVLVVDRAEEGAGETARLAEDGPGRAAVAVVVSQQ